MNERLTAAQAKIKALEAQNEQASLTCHSTLEAQLRERRRAEAAEARVRELESQAGSIRVQTADAMFKNRIWPEEEKLQAKIRELESQLKEWQSFSLIPSLHQQAPMPPTCDCPACHLWITRVWPLESQLTALRKEAAEVCAPFLTEKGEPFSDCPEFVRLASFARKVRGIEPVVRGDRDDIPPPKTKEEEVAMMMRRGQ